VRALTAELESERTRYSELQRKSREVPQLEAALLALQRELSEETSRGIGMEEQLTEALEAEQNKAAAALVRGVGGCCACIATPPCFCPQP
jgi:hypothetical protein